MRNLCLVTFTTLNGESRGTMICMARDNDEVKSLLKGWAGRKEVENVEVVFIRNWDSNQRLVGFYSDA